MYNKTILVLSGGSLKGIAHIGVMKALKKKDILKNIKTIAGSSIGGIIGCLYNIGYSPEELEELVNELDFSLFKDVKLDRLLGSYGVDDGNKMEYVLEQMFKIKDIDCDITFLELYKKTNIELFLTTVCVNDKKLCYLSYKSHPDLKIITGLRMTSCIPFWFSPISYQNKFYIDGGMMNNYPINMFRKNKINVIGAYLNEEREILNGIGNIEEYLFAALDCIFEGISLTLTEKYEEQTIKLNLPAVSLLNLNIDENLKNKIFECGYNQTLEFIENIKEKKEIKKKEKITNKIKK
jgi:NTE family protein